MNLGRNQLLGWINQVLQCEYGSIQMLADGIAFCQMIDAVYPGSINISRVNLGTRYPDDCLRNLRILQSALKKLKINQPASFQKISQGKFQDNINFLQWIYTHSMKNGIQNLQIYEPFNRRLQILQKQAKTIQQMNAYLIPTQAYLSQDHYQGNLQQNYNQDQDQGYIQNEQNFIEQKKIQIKQKLESIRRDAGNLQSQLKNQMQTNWKLMHNLQRSIQDRNTLYSLLKQIQTIVKQSENNTSIGAGILSIISQIPEDFL